MLVTLVICESIHLAMPSCSTQFSWVTPHLCNTYLLMLLLFLPLLLLLFALLLLLFFKILFIYLFIYGCVGPSFLCEGSPQLRQAGATLHRGARASHYRGLSCCGAQAQTRRLSSCGARAQLLRGMWDLPRPGLEPMSPALAGRLSTTVPPGKPSFFLYLLLQWNLSSFDPFPSCSLTKLKCLKTLAS